MSKKHNVPDVDDTPPPAYQEVAPPFNPNYHPSSEPSSSSFNANYGQAETPSFNPNYNPAIHSPPHTPELNYQRTEGNQGLYPQIPVSPSPPMVFPQPHHYQQQYQQQQQQPRQPYFPQHNHHPNQQVRYQTIEIPYTASVNSRIRANDRPAFPLAAVLFLFGCVCPPLWIIGACCCAGSRNKYESFWGKINFIMAMALIISSLIFSMISMSE